MNDRNPAPRLTLDSHRNSRQRPALHRTCVETLESRRLLTTYAVDLGLLPGGTFSDASDINAAGHVVGTGRGEFGESRAFIWRNGVMSDLGTLGGTDSQAHGINDAGQVVGESTGSATGWRAFLVTPEDTDGNGAPDRWFRDSNSDGRNDLMRDLGTIGASYTYSSANDVNNLGQVVGTARSGSTPRAFRWQNGVMTDLGLGNGSEASAINDAGQIVGRSISGGQSHAFLWKAGVGTDLGLSGGAADINAAGQVVDWSDPLTRIWTPAAANGSSGTFAELGQTPPQYPDGWVRSFALGINALGQVVGTEEEAFYSETTNGLAYRGVRWIDRVPELLPLEFATAISHAGQIVGSRGGRATLLADENFAVPLILTGNTTLAEGNTGTTQATVTVSLSRAAAQPITVHYATADDSASAGSDYVATSGTLTFAPGVTGRTFNVTVLGDREGEGSELFHVNLSSPTNAIIVINQAVVSIAEEEPGISANQVTVIEGNAGSVTALLAVSLSRPYDQSVVVEYETRDGTATAGSDYVAASGTVTFAPGQTVRQVAVTIRGDRVAEMVSPYPALVITTEDLYLSLYSPNGNGTREGTVIIQDDEPTLSVRGGGSVSEGNAGTTDAVFTVTLSAPYDQEVSVDYRNVPNMALEGYEDAMALAGSDYATTAGTVRFAPGETSRTVRVPVLGDTLDELNEYFFVGIEDPSGNAWIDEGYRYAAAEIRDDDTGPMKTFVGAGGAGAAGDWSTATNWSPAGVPAATDSVRIAGRSVTLGSSMTIANLTLSGGATLTLGANGARVLRTSSLAISADSVLNLNDNDLVLDYTIVSPTTETVARLIAGRGVSPTGIYSPQANGSGGLRTLGVAEACDVLGLTGAQTATFSGQAVDATTVLVKFTYAGDANLDGKIDVDDYGEIDFNVNTPGANGWCNGDFNYDGKINIDDYGIIDFNIVAQSSLLGSTATTVTASSTPSAAVSDATAIFPSHGLAANIPAGAVLALGERIGPFADAPIGEDDLIELLR